MWHSVPVPWGLTLSYSLLVLWVLVHNLHPQGEDGTPGEDGRKVRSGALYSPHWCHLSNWGQHHTEVFVSPPG